MFSTIIAHIAAQIEGFLPGSAADYETIGLPILREGVQVYTAGGRVLEPRNTVASEGFHLLGYRTVLANDYAKTYIEADVHFVIWGSEAVSDSAAVDALVAISQIGRFDAGGYTWDGKAKGFRNDPAWILSRYFPGLREQMQSRQLSTHLTVIDYHLKALRC